MIIIHTNKHKRLQKKNQSATQSSIQSDEPQAGSSIYLVEPGTREAIAAEQRLAMKSKKPKQQSIDDRRTKTKDLLFGDGLKDKELSPNPTSSNINVSSNTNVEDGNKPTENDIIMSGSKAAESAINRVKMKGSHATTKERKERTAMLIHGDLLKDENEVQPSLRGTTEINAGDEGSSKTQVEQALRNLQNCNSHVQVAATAKLLSKIIANIISAETLSDQEKFGKLRLANAKIKQAFADLTGGLECLTILGFEQQSIESDTKVMEDYMVFDFSKIDKESLWHALHLIDLYYPQVEQNPP